MFSAAHQATYLLRRQLEAQERDFLANGGFTERLHAACSAARKSDGSDGSDSSDGSDKAAPACPLCGKAMRRREARTGPHAGEPFRGLLPLGS